MRRAGVVFGLLSLALAFPGLAEDLDGELTLVTRGGKRMTGEALRDAVVWFHPAAAVPARPAATPAVITTRGKQFIPRVLPVTVGTTVRFPNEDPILHNVFSVTPGGSFDIGLVGKGEGRSHTFEEPGVIRVFCNVHHSMVAYVVALDTPFFTAPRADGSFRLTDVPPGPGRLTSWHPLGEAATQDVTLPAAAPLVVTVIVTQKRVPKHLDKLGEPYSDTEPADYAQ